MRPSRGSTCAEARETGSEVAVAAIDRLARSDAAGSTCSVNETRSAPPPRSSVGGAAGSSDGAARSGLMSMRAECTAALGFPPRSKTNSCPRRRWYALAAPPAAAAAADRRPFWSAVSAISTRAPSKAATSAPDSPTGCVERPDGEGGRTINAADGSAPDASTCSENSRTSRPVPRSSDGSGRRAGGAESAWTVALTAGAPAANGTPATSRTSDAPAETARRCPSRAYPDSAAAF